MKLQHCLGVAYHDGKIYVADTYNNKIKIVNASNGATATLVGTGEPGKTDDPPRFDEPAGISYAAGRLYVADTNSHAIRVIDIATRKVSTLQIAGLAEPKPPVEKKPSFAGAKQVKSPTAAVKAENGAVTLAVRLAAPRGLENEPAVEAQSVGRSDGRRGAGRTGETRSTGDRQAGDRIHGPGSGEGGRGGYGEGLVQLLLLPGR